MMIWLPALWVATGICLFAAVHFLHVINTRHSPWRYRAFGALSLVVACYLGLGTVMETPAPHAAWDVLERLHAAVACLIWPVGIWFIALYSRLRTWRWWVIGAAILFGFCGIVALVDPRGLLLAGMTLRAPYVLPWGEQVNQFTGTTSPWAPLYYAANVTTFLWALWRCAAMWRAGHVERARPIIAYLLVQLAATIWSDYTTWHAAPGLSWDGLPFVALVVVLSRALNREMQGYARALDATNQALRDENVRRAEAESNLRTVAYRDAISGLPNRHALLDHLTGVLATQATTHHALVVMDPRRFGVINHALGHAIGDAVIRKLAERLAAFTAPDGFAARLSGDEFAAVLPLAADVDPGTAALQRATELHRHMLQPLQLAAYTFVASVETGVVPVVPGAGDPDQLLRHAYAALYAAKQGGDNRVQVFTETMQAEAVHRLQLEVDLRHALAHGQLRLLYQPQVDARGHLVGAEALLRWQHPVHGLLSPAAFIDIAETSGQMPELGDWVLRTALSDLRHLPAPADFRLSVNVSPWQVFLDGYPDSVRAALAASGVDPGRITLELTETAFIHDVAGAAQKLRDLATMGIDIAVDDFGTGYAAVALLKNFPVRELKIDQSFVHDMSLDPPDRLIAAMVALGKAMRLRVVAEGVEQPAQRDALLQLGCTVLQGFLIGYPMDARDLAARLRAETAPPAAPVPAPP